MAVRFDPALCPYCQAPIEARYSQYRRSRPHRLFAPLLAFGVVATTGLLVMSFVWTDELVWRLTQEMDLRRRERGTQSFLAFIATLVPIGYATRWWWRRIHRLPRWFTAECKACPWIGPCRVYADWS